MDLSGNTILITGGTSGIGRALAEAFHRAGNRVLITGRRKGLLDEITQAHPGMQSAELDIADGEAIPRVAAALLADHPGLNVVIHNAGIMRSETLAEGKVGDAEAMIATNLLGPIRLTAALLPHLLRQPKAAIMTVTSGLAFVPLALTPTYSATKAAIHSYTQSLRHQLRGSPVQVLELAPPYVQTELQGPRQARDPMAMPLKDFITEVMDLLKASPGASEILVERVKAQRYAERSGEYDAFFTAMNERVAAARADWS